VSGERLQAEPRHLFHADLQRVSDESAYRSRCPFCANGILFGRRDQTTMAMIREDNCVSCAQRVVYLDESINGEPLR
jgi:hypothetical protein